MRILADTHVHWYDSYDPAGFLRRAFVNLRARAAQISTAAAGAERRDLLCLTQRAGESRFAALRAGGKVSEFTIEPLPDPAAVAVRDKSGSRLFIVAGRQIVCRERIEVLAIGADVAVPDDGALPDTLAAVRAAGAWPVIAWAPGKWMFGRGRILADLIARAAPADFALGDSSLRPRGWPTPPLIRTARARGFVILAGSDPLPPPEEARLVACYVCVFDAPFDDARPATSLRAALASGVQPQPVGSRGGLLETFRRLSAYRCWKKQAGAQKKTS